MKLAAKLILIVFVAIALLTCASAYLTVRHQFESFQREREEKARALKPIITDQLSKAWKEHGRPGVADALSGMPMEMRHSRMRWVEFGVESGHPDAPQVSQTALRRVVTGEIESVVTRSNSGEGWLHTYVPIDENEPVSTGVELSESLSLPDEQRRHTIRSTLATLAGLALVSLGVIMFAGVRLIGRPLEQLVEKTEQIGTGDLGHSIAIRGNDELSKLGIALNEMSSQIQNQKATIETETTNRIAAVSQLRHADRLKTVGRLSAGIAHEVGTPLNVVAGRAGLIASGRLSSEEIHESAETIKQEADRITAIIRQLLDFSRRTALDSHMTDLCTVVERTVGLLRSFAKSNRVTLELQDAASPLRANLDEGQIQQVLTNIIMNGIQSIAAEGRISVSMGTRTLVNPEQPETSPKQYAFVEVCDDGVGVDAENQEHLFEPFFTTKDVGEGTGLGLSIAYGIVQEHDGWIDVQSQPGAGSCFTVFLPQENQ
ncbi:sensor histidine kinase [Adhaeretor mobilis]|uniref:histidine kinase n=1 Tax=Adhaeretor mobilis TaxID=1930276 RepID=A0A517MQ36_9BACT|nr:HAMP domain-containing sensor histidine kinase [Adhaeretor mobilis]QDS96897.1 Sensor protein ZraS [Adhaeretor mobilis]